MAKEKTRIADIRRWAKKARMADFGEQHVRAGTSADDFFKLLTERFTGRGSNSEGGMTKTKEQRQFEAGRRKWAALVGRDVDDDTATKDKDKEDDDDDEDRDDDVEADDPEDENDGKKKLSDEEQAKRGARAFRRVADRFGLASVPARNSARKF